MLKNVFYGCKVYVNEDRAEFDTIGDRASHKK